MSKEVLIETIRQHNPTAGPEFLVRFDESALQRYLNHLLHLLQPRTAGWIRQFETRAIVCHSRGEGA